MEMNDVVKLIMWMLLLVWNFWWDCLS